MMAMRLSRKARWAVPAAAVVITGGTIAGSVITVAQAAPSLPPKTPAQLLADVASTQTIPPLTGTVVETASLGLPALPQVGNSTSLTSLITGSHTIKVYWENGKHFRLAIPQQMSETDLIRDGSTAWLWESTSNSVTKFSLAGMAQDKTAHDKARKVQAQLPPLTPQQAANEALAAVGPTTVVSVDSAVDVAGEPAYQLVLAPKDSRSTIGSIRIAIDAKTNVPLRVQVFAKGASSPALQVSYTQISYVAPSPANFAFAPPPGATVHDAASSQDGQGAGQKAGQPSLDGTSGSYGSGWLTVAEVPESLLSQAQTSPSGSPAGSSAESPGTVFAGDGQLAINKFLGAGTPVSGSWGTGQLIHTSLVNILVVGNEMYMGAVEPSVLYAAVGHATPAGNS